MNFEIIERVARFEGDEVDPTFRDEMCKLVDTDVKACYQCAKCTAGCPMNEYMDYGPHQLIRLIYLGLKERALRSTAIWYCVSCMTCTTRCPMEIKIDELIDVMRERSVQEGKASVDTVTAFHRFFLDTVRKYGRVYEMGMLMRYRLKRLQFFNDVDMGATLALKGKMGILPHSIKARDEVREIFEKLGCNLNKVEPQSEPAEDESTGEEEE